MAFHLFNYGKAGSGVQKGGPRKKPFFLFWEIFGDKFWKFFQINLIYILFCIPIVTLGPATAAVTQVMRKFVIGEPIFVFHEFWEAFKKNFKQSFFVGIVDIAFIAIILYNANYYFASLMNDGPLNDKIMLAVSLAMCFILCMMHFYIYPQIVALNLKIPQIIKNSVILMIVGMKRSFTALIADGLLIFLMALGFPYTTLLLPLLPAAWICFINTFCAYPVIQKHIIDPYYEARGEKNPEYARYETTEEAVFEDRGGFEAPSEITVPKKTAQKTEKVKIKSGKVIK